MKPLPKETIKVRLYGDEFWLLSELREGRGRAIAPLHHCDERGNVIKLEESFAHWYPDGNISRYGKIIGKTEDLEPIEESHEAVTAKA